MGAGDLTRLIDAFLGEFSNKLTLAQGYMNWVSRGSLRLTQYLVVRECPAGDPFLRRWAFNNAVSYAAQKGDLDALQWLLESNVADEFLTKAVAEAASCGQLHILEWLWANHRSRGYWGGTELCEAMRNHHSAVAAWLRGHVMPRPECAESLMEDAADCGDLTTLQWLSEHFDVNMNCALDLASRRSHWDMAKWIVKNCELVNSPHTSYSTLFQRAAFDGNLEFLVLASDSDPWPLTADILTADAACDVIESAVRGGHSEVVKWLHEELGFSWAGNSYNKAAQAGHLGVLKYLHEKRAMDDTKQFPMDEAARGGYIDVVQWLHANFRQKCTTDAMDWAAECGHLEVVQWLHKNRKEGCTSAAMHLAAANGHLDVAKWLHEHRSEGCEESTLELAATHGRLETMQWLHGNRHEVFIAPEAMNIAATRGRLDIVKWLHENRSEGCTVEAMDGAAGQGHLDMVKWLCKNRSEGCTPYAINRAIQNGRLDIAVFLHAERHECGQIGKRLVIYGYGVEVAEWMLAHFPQTFKKSHFAVLEGDWYFDEWLQRANQMLAN